jgi:L-cysteine:1D-myo-inositol 2-amino-2-deoxy-alpha-D-glucopyranoside ligase
MQLYNVLTGKKETFEPDEGRVSIYVCGITPYDTTHLGHAFTYTSFDVLIRYLEYLGHEVTYVQNVTDIDDDILRKAREVGEDWKTVGDRWTAHFIHDMKALNVRPPEHFPRATEVITEMIAIIEALLAAGYAYTNEGNVYFHVDSWEEFGKLSKVPRHEMLAIANERGNHPDDPHKRDPLDFVLWQAQADGEPGWDSPWGAGRPGWHIECSTMATDLLGNTVDIHGGGADLVFPHHECEIAQAEGATGVKPFVRFWMHTAMVEHEGEKMSKSLGNLIMIRDLLEEGWHPDALRLYLNKHHYRDAWEYHQESLEKADQLARTLRQAVAASSGSERPLSSRGARETFISALDDDLDTPIALMAMEQFAEQILRVAAAGRDVRQAQATLRKMAAVFGLSLDQQPDGRVTSGWDRHLQQFS